MQKKAPPPLAITSSKNKIKTIEAIIKTTELPPPYSMVVVTIK